MDLLRAHDVEHAARGIGRTSLSLGIRALWTDPGRGEGGAPRGYEGVLTDQSGILAGAIDRNYRSRGFAWD